MANFLEELYYGNIDPQARGYRKGSHNLEVSKDINELEEKADRAIAKRRQGAVPQFLQRLRGADGRNRPRFLPRRFPPRRKNDF